MTVRATESVRFLALVFALVTPPAWGQGSGELQSLMAAQQAALGTGDTGQILRTSKRAAAMALRLVATVDLGKDRGNDLGNDGGASARELLVRSSALDAEPGTTLLLLAADLRAKRAAAVEADRVALLEMTGDVAQSHLLLAQTFQAGGDLPSTIRELTAALALDPTLPAVHLALGSAYWQMNEFQYNGDSLREFTLAQKEDPGGFLPNFDLGALLSQYHRYGEAAHFLELAAAADPASPDPPFQMGMNLYAEADPTVAAAQPRSAAQPLPAAEAARPELERAVLLTGTDVAHNSYQIRRALTVLSRMAAMDGREAEAGRLRAEADGLHAKLLAEAPTPTLSESTTAETAAPRALRPKAEVAAGRAAEATGADPLRQQLLRVAASALNDAGTALARTHDYTGALPLFREAALADATLSPVLRNLGLAAFHTGDFAGAKEALTRALAVDPGDALARRYLDQMAASAS